MDVAKNIKRLTRSPARRAVAAADALRDARNWAGAADAYEKALDLDPNRAAIWVQYGHALKESGKVEEAEAAYRRAISIDDQNADSHVQLGHALKISGRLAEAARAYMAAFELDPSLSEALREIQDLALRGTPVPADRLEAAMDRLSPKAEFDIAPSPSGGNAAELAAALERLGAAKLGADDKAMLDRVAARLRELSNDGLQGVEDRGKSEISIVFDASDLVHYLRHSRLPTGIQRVQLEIIRSVVRADPETVQICASYDERWTHIPTSLFLSLADLSTRGGDINAPDWRTAATRLEIALNTDRSYQFPAGACLINLGTSWHVDYLLKIRTAKREFGIRFVPFVHDLIPIVASQYVLADLTRDYVAWLLSVFDHADFFLTNSRSTRADLIAAAHSLGHMLAEEDVLVIPLDAQFSSPADTPEARRAFLRSKGLKPQSFVLFVSTVEPRKNHLAAINAWSTLLREFGPHMPKLICVGGKGWMNDDVFGLVSANEELARHVTFLHGLSDVELGACYDACLFTLFPSHYEGWGLPVTESLCHGKIPLLSDSSSLPEAAGPFGVYFQSGSQPALVSALRKLIGDADYRRELEQRIATEFKPRAWDELATQIRDAIAERFAGDAGDPLPGTPEVRLGSFYAFGRNQARRLRPDLVSGYALRTGTGWYSPEDFGSWTRGLAVAIEGRFPAGSPIRAYLGLLGMPGAATVVTVSVDGKDVIETQLPGSEIRWLPLAFQPSDEPVLIELRSDRVVNLSSVTNGEDGRTVGPGLLGFYACRADDIGARLAFVEALATGVMLPGALLASMTETPIIDIPAVLSASPNAPEPIVADQETDGSGTLPDEMPILPDAAEGAVLIVEAICAEIPAPELVQGAVDADQFDR
ncbi:MULTISPECIES: glycosyltransferase family 4 protein [Sphingomonas]|jgi:glycosyltransferase involved in cell wall biosynthesis|uniref:glycosyltransferase family 4 protein n=6 Tax=Bacteria TaxID=2 RepID=UPI001AE7A104